MAALLILGNMNQYTFANSIVAANAKAQEELGQLLTDIFVIHSEESYESLHHEMEWVEHLKTYGISQYLLTERVVPIPLKQDSAQNPPQTSFEQEPAEEEEKRPIQRFVEYMQLIIKGKSDDSKIIVDLTNGTALQKNLLSIVAYVLDLEYQYAIDITQLRILTGQNTWKFLPADTLLPCYTQVPKSTEIDDIAYLNLSEVIRYKKIIETHTGGYASIDQPLSDSAFFGNNLQHSIQLKLSGDRSSGDRSKINALYRIAVSSIAASIEDLIRLMVFKFLATGEAEKLARKPLGERLKAIRIKVEKLAPVDFDLEFFTRFNDFILYLRNSSTHKGELLTDLEKIKADLSIRMAFPFIAFYTDIVSPVLAREVPASRPKQFAKLSASQITPEDRFYYGLDGDDTGALLEELFLYSSDENKFRQMSTSISRAINTIAKLVQQKAGNHAVVFNAGDDLLFKGNFPESLLAEMQVIYKRETEGLTCSIGYGRSFQEVYVALKLAKTQPGKNSIMGVELR